MIRRRSLPVWLLIAFASLTVARAHAGRWPQWRGPDGNSVCPEVGLPLRWNEDKNVVWKCPLPGEGASTPAVWDKAVFVTCQRGEDLLLVRVDADSGKVLWERTVGRGGVPRKTARPRGSQKFHQLHNLASPSPVTDGRRVVVHFGNGDLAAFDCDGRLLWKRNLQDDHGSYTIWWGHANSPVLVDGLVISACLQDSLLDLGEKAVDSYLAAHDLATGELRWKTLRNTSARAEECDAYTTPLVRTRKDGVRELIVMGGRRLDACDPQTGRQLWQLDRLGGNRTITGPTLAGDLLVATCGMRGELFAVRLGGTGELAADAVLWRTRDSTPDTPCPVVVRDLVFLVSDNGIAQCLDARTGQVKWKERLPGDYKASPLAADGRIWFLNLQGRCTLVAAEPAFRKLAENTLDDTTIASPAVADGRVYLRGRQFLWCLGSR